MTKYILNITSGQITYDLFKKEGEEWVAFNEAMDKGFYHYRPFSEKFIEERVKALKTTKTKYKSRLAEFIDAYNEIELFDEVRLYFGTEDFCKANLDFILFALKEKDYTGNIVLYELNEAENEVVSIRELEYPEYQKTGKSDSALVEYLYKNLSLEEIILDEEVETSVKESKFFFSSAKKPVMGMMTIPVNDLKVEKNFYDTLCDYIDEKELNDPDVYKKANFDRKQFSKMKNPDYHVSKNTAIAYALALELNQKDTDKLLKTAGYSLSDSLLSDVIIKYFISIQKYDLKDINEVLLDYDQKLL